MTLTLLGFGWDASSSHARGPGLAPGLIRAAVFSPHSSPRSIAGRDLRAGLAGEDFADLPEDGPPAREAIRARTAAALEAGTAPLALGGDHSITFPILQAVSAARGPVNVLHIDAHPDLYDSFAGDPYAHACPFARALEAGCIDRLVQLGIRATAPEQIELGAEHGVYMLGPDDAEKVPLERLTDPLYVSIDLDGLDPAFAPAVSHPEPAGLTTREVVALIDRLPAAPVGGDVVELNPERDMNAMTAQVAARLVKELAGKMAAG